jgi:hypothetical protein
MALQCTRKLWVGARVGALLWLLAAANGRSIPDRAAGGEAAGGRCAPGPAEVEWGSIEQRCDHFTRASWTPGSKHMRHDMMREEGTRGRTAEGHANAYTCRLQQRYCMSTRSWNAPVGPVLLVVGGAYPIDGHFDGFVLEAASKLGEMRCGAACARCTSLRRW